MARNPYQMSLRIPPAERAWLAAQPEGITGTILRLVREEAARQGVPHEHLRRGAPPRCTCGAKLVAGVWIDAHLLAE